MKENEASATAYAVMQGLLHIGRANTYPGLVSAETMETGTKILSASPEGRRRIAQLSSPLMKAAVPLIEWATLPGLTLHYALRKRYIEAAVRAAMAEGVTQVVNLGAGFDTLAWRLHLAHPEVNFIEIDHPATSGVKAPALRQIGTMGDNLHLLEVDFTTQTLADRLGGLSGFKADRPTMFVCEGVITYLTRDEAGVLLQTLNDLCAVPPRLVCTCVVPAGSPDDNIGPFLGIYLKLKGEALKWRIAHEDVGPFFAEHNFDIDEIASPTVIKPRFIEGPLKGTLHRSEYGVIARGVV
jgi:methyltransferase (TIGR00027 family)